MWQDRGKFGKPPEFEGIRDTVVLFVLVLPLLFSMSQGNWWAHYTAYIHLAMISRYSYRCQIRLWLFPRAYKSHVCSLRMMFVWPVLPSKHQTFTAEVLHKLKTIINISLYITMNPLHSFRSPAKYAFFYIITELLTSVKGALGLYHK